MGGYHRIGRLILAIAAASAAAALLGSASQVQPARRSPPRLELTSVHGAVQIRVAGTVQAYSQGSPMPVELPLGSVVTVRGLKAEFRGMGILVRATSSDAFAYDLVGEGNDGLALHLAALGEETALEVAIGESRALLEAGDAIAVSEPAPGRHEVRVLAGAPAFLSGARLVALGPGQLWAWPPWTRMAADSGPGEELRSAVAARPANRPARGPQVRPAPKGGPLDLGALTPLEPARTWKLGVHGGACRPQGAGSYHEPARWGRCIDLPGW